MVKDISIHIIIIIIIQRPMWRFFSAVKHVISCQFAVYGKSCCICRYDCVNCEVFSIFIIMSL